jgi:undecaprenyl-diphosphatase
LLFYRRDVAEVACGAAALIRERGAMRRREGARLFVLIVLASIPAAVAGLALRPFFEDLFTRRRAVGLCLLATGCVLAATRWSRPHDRRVSLSCLAAFGVGVAQAVAIMPGISRSGMTIAAALALGARRVEAARFSFLIAIPATLGAFVLEVTLHGASDAASPAALIMATALAAIVGYLALIWLTRWVRRGRLHWFAVYVIPLGLLTLLA